MSLHLLADAVRQVVNTCPAAPVPALTAQDRLWEIVGVVFIAEFVLPPIVAAVKGVGTWIKDLRDLREDLYEEGDEDEDEEATT